MSRKRKPVKPAPAANAVKMPPRDTRADGNAWFGTADQLTDPTSQKLGDGGVGAGLSAPNYTQPGETTAGVDTPAQAFIAAVRANDKAAIKTTYAVLPRSGPASIAAAYEIKDAFFNGSAADRATFKANVAANKEIFPAKNYADFQTMMTMTSGAVESGMRWVVGPRPKPDAKPPANPVALEGQDALANMGEAGGSPELAGAINREATRLGVNPTDLATAIGYETVGTFSPSIRGGAGNKYVGLIQFGPAEQKHYGIVPGMSADAEMVKVGDFLRDRGLQPGSGLLDIYSTINAGSPGHPGWKDASGLTVAQHVARMQAAYRPRAEMLLAGTIEVASGQDVIAGGDRSVAGRDVVAAAIRATGGISKGSRNTAANKAVQGALASLAVGDRIGAPLKADGVFGNRTKEAVKNFQAREGLNPDGVVGPQTLAKINASLAAASFGGATGAEGSPELAGQVAPTSTRDFAAGAAAAAVTVDPAVTASFGRSTTATLAAAVNHPDTFVSSDKEWDPAAARIAGILRDGAAMDAQAKAAMAKAGKTSFAPPIEGSAVPQTLEEYLGGGPGTGPGKEHQFPPQQGLGADVNRAWESAQRAFDIEHWLQEPTVDSGAGTGTFGTVIPASDPYRPTGGYEPGGSNGSSSGGFDAFASGMAQTYTTVGGGGSVFGGSTGGGSATVYSGATPTTYQDSGNPAGNDYSNVGGIP